MIEWLPMAKRLARSLRKERPLDDEDLVQVGLEELLLNAHKQPQDPEHAQRWAWRIMKNRMLKENRNMSWRRRHEKREDRSKVSMPEHWSVVPEDFISAMDYLPESLSGNEDFDGRLFMADLESLLTERQKDVLHLAMLGLDDTEVATALGVVRRTVNNDKLAIRNALLTFGITGQRDKTYKKETP